MSKEKNTIASVAWPLGKLYVLVSIKAFSGRALCASALMSNSNTTAPIIAMLTKKMSWYLFLYARKARRRKERKRSFIGLMISVMKMMNGVRDSVWNAVILLFMKVFMQMPTDMQNRSYFLNKFSL